MDIIRWLAITHRYRRDCYFAAAFLGRFVRYGLLATTATCLSLSWTGIAIIQGSLVGLIGLRYLPRLTQHRKQVRLREDSVKEQGAVSA